MIEWEDRSARYNTASVCENGHLFSSCLEHEPEKKHFLFCKQCGKKLLTKCPDCGREIVGCRTVEIIPYHEDVDNSKMMVPGNSVVSIEQDSYISPSYCQYCQSAFPWTKSLLAEIDEIISMADEFDEVDQAILREKFPLILLPDTPGKTVAALRISKILKTASISTASAFKSAILGKLSGEVLKIFGWI